jgi:hypothetical protein
MSDVQLADRLEQTWQAHSQAEEEATPYKLWASFRGPIRHRLAYPFLSWIGVGYGLGWAFGPSFSFSIQALLSTRHRALMRIHLALCEARDITDEMRHRVKSGPQGFSVWRRL